MACGTPVIVSAGGSTDDFVGGDEWKVETRVDVFEGVQLVSKQLEGKEPGAFQVEELGEGWYVKATTRELLVDRDDLYEKMVAAVKGGGGGEGERARRAGRVRAEYSWDVVAERILEELLA
jgi:glycosyltransferase involved in cell wall biosynthesis